jgi:hypothetical protein
MSLFAWCLGEDAHKWFKTLPEASYKTLAEALEVFKDYWGEKKDDNLLLAELTDLQKKDNETVKEFNTRFEKALINCIRMLGLLIILLQVFVLIL